ncbi:MAG: Gx transporter family protein [Nevskiales bacterium]|nr:Gx transporter family protein [Nevskiales bacterium]
MTQTQLIADREDRLVAGFATLAIVIHVIEAGFPSPIPGVKPGLANVITLIVLLRHSLRMAIWVAALRVLVGSLLVGSFMTPGFWLSASGALGSLLALSLGSGWNRLLPSLRLSAVGLSVLSALAHMGGQFFVAYEVFVPHPGLLRLMPPLLTAALVFGVATGLVAAGIVRRLGPPVPST